MHPSMATNVSEPEVAWPPDWRTRLQAWLNDCADFTAGGASFDGAVLVEMGDRAVWLKIYDGRAIDAREAAAVFGYTFALRGPAVAWNALLGDQRASVFQLVLLGRLKVDGNQLEFTRLSKLVASLVRGLRAVRPAP